MSIRFSKVWPVMLLLIAGLALDTTAFAATASSNGHATRNSSVRVDIRNLMSAAQYYRAGLNKLTPKEIKALNRWLSHYTQKVREHSSKTSSKTAAPMTTTHRGVPHTHRHSTVPTSSGSSNGAAYFGKPPSQPKSTPDHIVTHITGTFHGWHGNTRFRLTNGQVWVQAGPGYFDATLHAPRVVIKKLLFGYMLEVDGHQVFVRRVK